MFLRYLTVDYLLAELLQRSYSSDREALLRRALQYYESFLARLEDYDLLSPSDKKLYERYAEDPKSFTLAPMNDAAARREVKVNRFREEKELKQKLEVSYPVFNLYNSPGHILIPAEVPIAKPEPTAER